MNPPNPAAEDFKKSLLPIFVLPIRKSSILFRSSAGPSCRQNPAAEKSPARTYSKGLALRWKKRLNFSRVEKFVKHGFCTAFAPRCSAVPGEDGNARYAFAVRPIPELGQDEGDYKIEEHLLGVVL